MKKKSLNFIIPLMVYPFDVMFSFSETDQELFNRLSKFNGIDDDEFENAKLDGQQGMGRYCLFRCGASLIRLKYLPKTPFDYGCLQHEIFHAATAIMWKIGAKLKIKTSDESYAYLIQYLTEHSYNKIK